MASVLFLTQQRYVHFFRLALKTKLNPARPILRPQRVLSQKGLARTVNAYLRFHFNFSKDFGIFHLNL